MPRFSRRVPGLQTLLPSSGAQIISPSEAGESVHFVHPYPGKLHGLVNVPQVQQTSAAALTPLVTVLPIVAQGFIVEILAGDASHDSATTRILSFFLVDPAGLTVTVARAQQPTGLAAFPLYANAGGAAGASFASFGAQLPIIVPPGWRLDLGGDTAAAAYSITGRILGIAHTLAQGGLIMAG